MKVVGVDGCPSGWVAAGLSESDNCEVRMFPNIDSLMAWSGPTTLVLIDIPIGLVESGSSGRTCDTMARRLLGAPRASSVFSPPCRQALEATSWAEASEINESITGKRLSRQAWAIAPKIQEVDKFIRRDTLQQELLREVHPEVLLWTLNGQKPMRTSKKRSEGRRERLDVLKEHWPDAEPVFEQAMNSLRGQRVGADDIVDALVITVAWLACEGDFRTLPDTPEHDITGLRMEIIFPSNLSRYCVS